MSTPTTKPWFCPTVWLLPRVMPFLQPYYIVVAVVAGAISAVFGGLITVLVLIALNLNIFNLIE